MIRNLSIVTIGASLLTVSASADMTGTAYEVGRAWTGEDFGGVAVSGYVVDIYLEFDSTSDILLNVYNFNDANLGATYFQSATAIGWSPNEQGGIFTTEASQSFDSFIAIGGVTGSDGNGNPYQMAGNGVNPDPNFPDNTADGPGANAGWFNSNPNNPIGAAGPGGVLIGRFSLEGSTGFSMAGSTGWGTYNEGVGTPGSQMGFTVVPAPGALALLGVVGMASRRRRK